ncbi:MAG: hypothetical protein JO288_20830 [Hyphomicrobiales bacterium]|nr:hypothetical protein [Hyphomicrobiales bacterium]
MLLKLDAHIRECYERAAYCAERSKMEPDNILREEYVRMERSWTHLARSYELVQSLEAFLRDAEKRRSEYASRS